MSGGFVESASHVNDCRVERLSGFIPSFFWRRAMDEYENFPCKSLPQNPVPHLLGCLHGTVAVVPAATAAARSSRTGCHRWSKILRCAASQIRWRVLPAWGPLLL